MHELSFCSIDIQDRKIAEVVFKRNAEVTGDMIEEFLQVLTKNMGSEISVIVNKSTMYTYKHDALEKLSSSTVIKNLGIVAYDEMTASMSEFNKKKFNKTGRNIEIFKTKQEALTWVKETIE